MRVTRWNDALAVQIPDDVVKSLDLKEGDEVEISLTAGDADSVRRESERMQALEHIRSARWELPAGWKFDRDEANER